MRKKLFWLGMVLILGMVFIGCAISGNDNENKDNIVGTEKTIIITGFNNLMYNNRWVSISLFTEVDCIAGIGNSWTPSIISNWVKVSGQNLTFPLKANSGTPDWNGSYYVVIDIYELGVDPNVGTSWTIDKTFFYSKGIIPNAQYTNVPKFSIANNNLNIPFNLFSDLSSLSRSVVIPQSRLIMLIHNNGVMEIIKN